MAHVWGMVTGAIGRRCSTFAGAFAVIAPSNPPSKSETLSCHITVVEKCW